MTTRLFSVLVALLLGACTTLITETIEIYPTQLSVQVGSFELYTGESLGIGASAIIIGKKALLPSDSIGVIVRDPLVLQIIADFRSQQICDGGYGVAAVCLSRFVNLKGIRDGETYVIFRTAGIADSVRFTVRVPKG